MANEEKKHDCCERVNGCGRFGGAFNKHRCMKVAKVKRLVDSCNYLPRRDGTFSPDATISYKWFCSIHDPVQIEERQNKKDAEQRAEYERKRACEAVKATRQRLVDAVTFKLTNKQLVWLAARLDEGKDLQAELEECL
jgi:hypothetical protein